MKIGNEHRQELVKPRYKTSFTGYSNCYSLSVEKNQSGLAELRSRTCYLRRAANFKECRLIVGLLLSAIFGLNGSLRNAYSNC